MIYHIISNFLYSQPNFLGENCPDFQHLRTTHVPRRWSCCQQLRGAGDIYIFNFFFLFFPPLPSNLSLAREINSMEDLLMEKSKWNSWGKIQIVDIDFPCAVGSKEGAVDCLRGWKADEEFPIRF